MIETERLKIFTSTQKEMEDFINSQTIDVLKKAYTEMLNNSLQHPDKWEWYALWMIELKEETHIGELCFKGIDSNNIAEIGYSISHKYQNQGYATEAVKAIVNWAFENPNLTAIEAETERDNIASKRVLEKCGFTLNGNIGEEGPRYTYVR